MLICSPLEKELYKMAIANLNQYSSLNSFEASLHLDGLYNEWAIRLFIISLKRSGRGPKTRKLGRKKIDIINW